jgi:hypothetical protein
VPYAGNIDYSEKRIYLDLLEGKITWDDVQGRLDKIDEKRAAKGKGSTIN